MLARWRHGPRVWIALTVGLYVVLVVVTLVRVTTRSATTPRRSPKAAFRRRRPGPYRGPGGPGQLLSSQAVQPRHLSDAKAWRILYRTTTCSTEQRPTASAVVVVPTDASGSRPMVLWDHGTTGASLSLRAVVSAGRFGLADGVGRRGASGWRSRRPRLHRHGCRRADDVSRRGRGGARRPRRRPRRPTIARQRTRRSHPSRPRPWCGGIRRAATPRSGPGLWRPPTHRICEVVGVAAVSPATDLPAPGRHDQVERGRGRSADVIRARQLRRLLPRRQARRLRGARCARPPSQDRLALRLAGRAVGERAAGLHGDERVRPATDRRRRRSATGRHPERGDRGARAGRAGDQRRGRPDRDHPGLGDRAAAPPVSPSTSAPCPAWTTRA